MSHKPKVVIAIAYSSLDDSSQSNHNSPLQFLVISLFFLTFAPMQTGFYKDFKIILYINSK